MALRDGQPLRAAPSLCSSTAASAPMARAVRSVSALSEPPTRQHRHLPFARRLLVLQRRLHGELVVRVQHVLHARGLDRASGRRRYECASPYPGRASRRRCSSRASPPLDAKGRPPGGRGGHDRARRGAVQPASARASGVLSGRVGRPTRQSAVEPVGPSMWMVVSTIPSDSRLLGRHRPRPAPDLLRGEPAARAAVRRQAARPPGLAPAAARRQQRQPRRRARPRRSVVRSVDPRHRASSGAGTSGRAPADVVAASDRARRTP